MKNEQPPQHPNCRCVLYSGRLGATVVTHVADQLVGRLLHLMEYDLSLHLVSREAVPGNVGQECWHMRSAEFPAEYEGRSVMTRVIEGKLSIDAPR